MKPYNGGSGKGGCDPTARRCKACMAVLKTMTRST